MDLNRRRTIALIGGGVVAAAVLPAATFLGTRNPTKAQAPWATAGSYDDPRLNALSFALLAPNPHNLQPWLVELTDDNGVRLFHDADRRLPETDPFDRQITIGLGCFLEQMVIAASGAGKNVQLALYPDGPNGTVAHATFRDGGKADPLIAHIPDRRSCKEPFEDRPVEPAKANQLELYAEIYTDTPTVAALKALTWDAWMV